MFLSRQGTPDLNQIKHLRIDQKITALQQSPFNPVEPGGNTQKLEASNPRGLKTVITDKGASTKYEVKTFSKVLL